MCEVLVGGAVPIYLSSDILCGYVNNLLKEEIGRECVVSIYFVDKNLMKDINASTRGKDYATNVLSFSFNDDLGEKVYLGEILICEDEVLKDAELNGVKTPIYSEYSLFAEVDSQVRSGNCRVTNQT